MFISHMLRVLSRFYCVKSLNASAVGVMMYLLTFDVFAAAITSITAPVNGSYVAEDSLTFTVNFDENVIASVDGEGNSARMVLKLTSGRAIARYVSGTGTSALNFDLILDHKDFDFDGVEIEGFELSGATNPATIVSQASSLDADLTLVGIPDMSGILVNHGNRWEVPTNGTYEAGDTLNFRLHWGRIAAISTSATPQLTITVGATAYVLDGTSDNDGSLLFSHTVQVADSDGDGIGVDSFSLNNTQITGQRKGFEDNSDSSTHGLFSVASTFGVKAGVLVGSIGAPQITSVTVPVAGNYVAGNVLAFTVNLNEPVTVASPGTTSLTLDFGGEALRSAAYVSGSGTAALTFNYTVTNTDDAPSGITVTELRSGSIIFDAGVNLLDFSALNGVASGAGVIVDGNVPDVTSVTVPFATVYQPGDTLTFKVNIEEVVTVTGSPTLLLNIGGEIVEAVYITGSGTNSLTFQYQIPDGLDDDDGISVLSLGLNGGTILDAVSNPLNAQLVNVGSTTQVLVDSGTQITSVNVPSNATYLFGESLDFTVNFDGAVTVTGLPQLSIDVGGRALMGNYISGSGTSALLFRYSVNVEDNDTNGIVISGVRKQAASIKNANGLEADLTLRNVASTAGVLVDGGAPAGYAININQALVDATNQNATSFTFNNAEVGTTYNYVVSLSSGATGSVSGSGTVTNTAQTISGIDVSSLGDGELKYSVTLADVGGNTGAPVIDTVVKSTVATAVVSVSVPADATYYSNQVLSFTVNFSKGVSITGTPQLMLTLGSSAVAANYVAAGSSTTALQFQYTIPGTEADPDGIAINNLSLNGGTLKDSVGVDANLTLNGVPSTSGILVATGSGAFLNSGSAVGSSPFGVGDTITFRFTNSAGFAPTVSGGPPSIVIGIDSGDITATYSTNTGSSADFTYVVQNGDVHSASNNFDLKSLALNGATMTVFAAPFSLSTDAVSDFNGLEIAGAQPVVSSVTASGGSFKEADSVDVTVNFNESVTVTGTPQLTVNIGSTPTVVNYFSGSGSAALVFRHTVAAGENDADGIDATTLALNGGTILDTDAQAAVLTLNNVNTRNARIDTTNPTGYSISVDQSFMNTKTQGNARLTLSGADIGDTYNLVVTHNAAGAGVANASGTVTANPQTISGVDVSGIDEGPLLFSLSITDAAMNAGASVTDTVSKDTVVPVVTSVGGPIAGTYKLGASLSFTVVFDEAVIVSGSPFLAIDVGGSRQATYMSGSGTNTLRFQYVTKAGDLDSNGIAITGLSLGSATIQDGALNDVNTTLNSVASTSSVLVDAVVPFINSVLVPAVGVYGVGETLSFTVNFSQPVIVTGTPQLAITVGSATRKANYASGTGGTALQFSYVVVAGDLDKDGVTITGLSLNGGGIADTSLNTALLTLNAVADTSQILVDAAAPAGYAVSFVKAAINAQAETAISLNLSNAEPAAQYNFSIVSSNGGEAVIGSGVVSQAAEILSGINVSGLKDGVLTVSLTLTDGKNNQGAIVTATTNKVNDAPVFSDTPRLSGSGVIGSVLLIEGAVAVDPESSGVSYTYRWFADGVLIASVTTNSFEIPLDQVNAVFHAEVIASDGEDSTTATTVAVQASSGVMVLVGANLELNATGLLTEINADGIVATDRNGNSLTPFLVGQSLKFKPGLHQVRWAAEDDLGNRVEAAQTVTIHPLVSFNKDQIVTEGGGAEFQIILNGKAPNYPFQVSYQVGGTADEFDHDLVSGIANFGTGATVATVTLNVIADGVSEPDETILIAFSDASINAGAKNTHQVTIADRNIEPQVSLISTQGGVVTKLISQAAGNVLVESTVTDPNRDDLVTLTWTASGGLLDTDSSDSSFTFDPAAVSPGAYTLNVTATDNADIPASGYATLNLVVVEALPILTDADSDVDGISDEDEGFLDSDDDGIPDFLDAITATNVVPASAGNQTSFLLECEPGIQCRLGLSSLGSLGGGALVDAGTSNIPTDSDFNFVGGIFDFVIGGLPTAGASAAIVLPQLQTIPENAVYRKLSAAGIWVDFIENGLNLLHSSPGAEGICPPPNDDAWVPGLIAGSWCVQLTLEDGGPNDSDGLINQSIADPGGVAVAVDTEVPEQPPRRSSSSGGGIGEWLLLVLLIAGGWRQRHTRAFKRY